MCGYWGGVGWGEVGLNSDVPREKQRNTIFFLSKE